MDFNKLLANKRAVTFIALGVVGLIAFIWIFASFNGVQKEMVKREQDLSAQYQDNQNEYSSMIASVKEAMGIADVNAKAVNDLIGDAVKGRYDKDSSATAVDSAQLFSAVVEAYPEANSTSIPFQKAQDALLAARTAYKNKQTLLLGKLASYEEWKNSGFVHSKMASMVGAPSDNLVARLGNGTSRGQDALDKMYQIVLVKEALDAYESGVDTPMEFGAK